MQHILCKTSENYDAWVCWAFYHDLSKIIFQHTNMFYSENKETQAEMAITLFNDSWTNKWFKWTFNKWFSEN